MTRSSIAREGLVSDADRTNAHRLLIERLSAENGPLSKDSPTATVKNRAWFIERDGELQRRAARLSQPDRLCQETHGEALRDDPRTAVARRAAWDGRMRRLATHRLRDVSPVVATQGASYASGSGSGMSMRTRYRLGVPSVHPRNHTPSVSPRR